MTRRGLALCPFPPGGRIADVGCGTGASVRLLRESGYEAVGIDLHPRYPNMMDAAFPLGFPLIRARAEALPFARESLHGILCECVLSLVQDYAQTLKGFWEACLPGALLLFTDVYERDADCGFSTPASCNTASVKSSRKELESALRAAGWQVRHFEDHSRSLREYAAQALWRGEECMGAPVGRQCGSWGYGLWTAQKENL